MANHASTIGMIFINSNGLRWHDASNEYGTHKTLYNRWSDKGIFAHMMAGLAAEHGDDRRHLSESTSHSVQYWREKGGLGRLIDRTKGGINAKLHAICDSEGRPLDFFVTARQVSGYIGARGLFGNLPNVEWLLGGRGYDADWFREALKDKRGYAPASPVGDSVRRA